MRHVLCFACLFVVGCYGPMTRPMVERLPEEQQQDIDNAWVNMFSPPDRLDHTLLLDVIVTMELFQKGVDRLWMVSEKRAGAGLVVMEVRFDRDDPTFDEFTVTYVDGLGREVRRERYAREEIHKRAAFLFMYPDLPDDADAATREERIREHAKQQEARKEEIRAATRPALGP
jgi:hypothetical protein